jgi:hypothetical protein
MTDKEIEKLKKEHAALYEALRELGIYAAALEMMLNKQSEGEALVNARAAIALVESEEKSA